MQTISGVDDCQSSFESKSDKAEFYKGLKYAIVNSMTGVNENNIKNLTANCIVRRLDTTSVSYWRRLAELSSSMFVSYFVKVRYSETNYQKLSQQLQGSVESGNFTKLLKEAFYNISAFRELQYHNQRCDSLSSIIKSYTGSNTGSNQKTIFKKQIIWW
jgi:hypothetical protein